MITARTLSRPSPPSASDQPAWPDDETSRGRPTRPEPSAPARSSSRRTPPVPPAGATYRPADGVRPRRFYLYRLADPSGVAGLGHVADSCWFPNGWVALAWRGQWATAAPWPSLAHVRGVHGHHHLTRIVWYDPNPDGSWTAPDGDPNDLSITLLDPPPGPATPPAPLVPPVPAAPASIGHGLARPYHGQHATCGTCGHPIVHDGHDWTHLQHGYACPPPYIGLAQPPP